MGLLFDIYVFNNIICERKGGKMRIVRLTGCWICMFSICVCYASTHEILMNNVDTYEEPVFIQLCQTSQFNDENMTVSSLDDTNKVYDKPYAQRVTFEKIGLEVIGAAAGGFACAYIVNSISPVFDDFDTWWITFPTSIALGTALGATLMGNLLMEPNGSFMGSLGGSSLGTAVACPLAFGAVLVGIMLIGHDDRSGEVYAWLAVAAALPVAGAVHGYNVKYMGCCSEPVQAEFDSDLHLRSNSPNLKCKIELLALNF